MHFPCVMLSHSNAMMDDVRRTIWGVVVNRSLMATSSACVLGYLAPAASSSLVNNCVPVRLTGDQCNMSD